MQRTRPSNEKISISSSGLKPHTGLLSHDSMSKPNPILKLMLQSIFINGTVITFPYSFFTFSLSSRRPRYFFEFLFAVKPVPPFFFSIHQCSLKFSFANSKYSSKPYIIYCSKHRLIVCSSGVSVCLCALFHPVCAYGYLGFLALPFCLKEFFL
jgi:hypothetical protein